MARTCCLAEIVSTTNSLCQHSVPSGGSGVVSEGGVLTPSHSDKKQSEINSEVYQE